MYHAVIMAGGTGSRLWPVSRRAYPKQLLKLAGEDTMFEHSVYRMAPLMGPEQIYVVARADLVGALSAQVPSLPDENYIVEPEGRGTAPAIGLAAIRLLQSDPDAVMAVVTADHHIDDTAAFRTALAAGQKLAEAGQIVTLGMKPSFASTGFGYIKRGNRGRLVDGLMAYDVTAFTEKPDAGTAEAMLKSGNYVWNGGMFIWRADRILQEFERQMPALYTQLREIAAALGTAEYEAVLAHVWPTVEKESVDFGIMEGAEDVVVLPVEIGWSDVGSWASVFDVRPTDGDGNILLGRHESIDTANTLVYGGKRLIATIGVDNLIIVDTPDALLICRRGHEQDVKAIVNRLQAAGDETLY